MLVRLRLAWQRWLAKEVTISGVKRPENLCILQALQLFFIVLNLVTSEGLPGAPRHRFCFPRAIFSEKKIAKTGARFGAHFWYQKKAPTSALNRNPYKAATLRTSFGTKNGHQNGPQFSLFFLRKNSAESKIDAGERKEALLTPPNSTQ